MVLRISLAADTQRVIAGAIHVVKLAFDEGALAFGRVAVDRFPGSGGREGELIWGDAENRA